MAIVPHVVRMLGQGNNNPSIEDFDVAASQTIVTGNFVAVAAGVISNAAAANTSGIVGLAIFDLTNGAAATTTTDYPVAIARNAVIRMNFDNSGAKKTFTKADLFTSYVLKTATSLDPNTTTNGFLQVVGYDNTNLTVDVVVKASAQYIV